MTHENSSDKRETQNLGERSHQNNEEQIQNWRQRSAPYPRPNRGQYQENNSQRVASSGANSNNSEQNSTSSNVRALQKTNNSEFVEELCWDVDTENQTELKDLEIKIVSPRIKANIEECEIAVLVDCGSEVTAVSEIFYDQLKSKYKIVELPVSNLTVNVAVGNKTTTINAKCN